MQTPTPPAADPAAHAPRPAHPPAQAKPSRRRDRWALYASAVAMAALVLAGGDFFLFGKISRYPDWMAHLPWELRAHDTMYWALVLCLAPAAWLPRTLPRALLALAASWALSPLALLAWYAISRDQDLASLLANLFFNYFWALLTSLSALLTQLLARTAVSAVRALWRRAQNA